MNANQRPGINSYIVCNMLSYDRMHPNLTLIQIVVSAGLLTSLTVLLLIIGKEIIQGVLWCLSVLLLLLRLHKQLGRRSPSARSRYQ